MTTRLNPTGVAMVIVGVWLLCLAGCGGGNSGKAKALAEAELAGMVLDGGVSCETSSSPTSNAHRYACHAGLVQGGVTQRVTIVVQCVDGAARCTRILS